MPSPCCAVARAGTPRRRSAPRAASPPDSVGAGFCARQRRDVGRDVLQIVAVAAVAAATSTSGACACRRRRRSACRGRPRGTSSSWPSTYQRGQAGDRGRDDTAGCPRPAAPWQLAQSSKSSCAALDAPGRCARRRTRARAPRRQSSDEQSVRLHDGSARLHPRSSRATHRSAARPPRAAAECERSLPDSSRDGRAKIRRRNAVLRALAVAAVGPHGRGAGLKW